MSLTQKDKLDYAWRWFEYHAGQRLTAFNFLLVLSGALAVALSKAFEVGMYEFSAIVGFFGAFAALGFFVLDRRNKNLVELGHEALRSIEGTEDSSETPAPWQLSKKDDVKRRQSFCKRHTFWLEAIAILLLILFAVATVVSALKVAEEHCP